jgi:hypothetical protein
VAINILDVANGRVTHSAVDLMGSGSRDIFNGVNTLVRGFMAGLRAEGETVVSAGTARQERASAAAANTETGIRVRTSLAGALYFQNEETATLWDNDEYLIAITRPGTYTVKMIFGNGQSSSRTIAIQGRGIVDAQFGVPLAPQNLRVGTAAAESVTLSWDGEGTGLSYRVYYHTENNPQTARVSVVSGTNTTVRNLTYGTDYYFWISVVDGSLEGEKSVVVSAKTVAYTIGGRGPAGGWVFYDKGSVTEGWRYLEAASVDLGSAEWGTYGNNVSGTATMVGTGKRNTQVIVEYLRSTRENGRAAQLCTAYRGGGYSDWFLPSKDELNLMYQTLKQKGLGGFSDLWYWSSSQNDYYDSSWVQNFGDGRQVNDLKDDTYSVRCVRAF